MQKQFNAQFKGLFKNAQQGLKRALGLKFKAITKADHKGHVIKSDKFKLK